MTSGYSFFLAGGLSLSAVSCEKMLEAGKAELDNRRRPSPYDLCWGC